MTTEYTISLGDPRATLDVAGGKGASLARLLAAGLPVPDGFHVTTEAYREFVDENGLQPRILMALESANPEQLATLEAASQTIRELFYRAEMPAAIAGAVALAYASIAEESPYVAVRSSATAEDLPGLSFAGQQDTYLNVQGAAAVLEAVQRCWASLWTARAIGYRARHNINQETVSLAAVVQLLVPAEAAGVLFTANPVTGVRNQATISVSWGLGESIVGGLVTPDMLTVDKATSEVLTRETADKQVMTVRVEGGTEEKPVPETLRRAPVLDDEQAAELVRLGVQIEQLYQRPMDIEWTLADGTFAIVQARPITALPTEAHLPKPEPPAPTDWPLPDPKGQYMRTSIIDLMPNPLTPLFATMGVPVINAGLVKLTVDMAGIESIFPEETMVTINDYAYMNARYTPRQWWWMMTKLVPAFPRMLRTGVQRWRDEVRPRYVGTVARWQDEPMSDLSPTEILTGIREVLEVAIDHLGALMVATMGASAGSEGLFTAAYDKLIKRPDDPSAQTFLLGFDSIPILAEKALYDLSQWSHTRDGLTEALLDMPSRQLAAQLKPAENLGGQVPQNVDADDWHEWQRRFRAYLRQYGHSIYDLDFSVPLPADDPVPMLETVKLFIRGEGRNPHARQQASTARREQAVRAMQNRLRGLRLKIFRKTLGWAQTLAPLREDGIADIGLGYPLLRRMLQELGRRSVQAGATEQADDIFWLVQNEVEDAVAALEADEPLSTLVERVQERRATWRAEKLVTPPPRLPAKSKYMAFYDGGILAASADEQTGDTINGLGASPGSVTATARVLRGPEDFDQMKPGDILVAGITTPAWTPLFAMAAGVVTDVGGTLSHGSIVAREYGIPAVLGTGVATKRIRSGQVITVDGSAGVVTLSENGS